MTGVNPEYEHSSAAVENRKNYAPRLRKRNLLSKCIL